jgi:parvulin-like peptidyl-prolyl isomerase
MKKFVGRLGTMLIFGSVLAAQTKPEKIVDRIVARVNDDIITQSDVNREMIQYRQELAQKFTGEQLEQEMKKAEKEVLEGLIRDKLFLQKAQELGIGSGMDVQVSAEIERMRKQYNIKDMDEFEKALEAQGMTLAGYRDYVKKQMIIGSLIGEFVDSRITLLSEEVERYYKDHAKDFSSPEEVTMSEILIPTSGVDGQSEAQAEEYRKRVLQGESFATVASQYSKGPTAGKGGGIGTFQVAKLNPQIASGIATVKEGDITPVIKLQGAFAFYRVDSRKPSVVSPFDSVKDQIRELLFRQKRAPEYERFVAQLKEDASIQVFAELGIGK